jgi:DNA-binding XRE family transcriptional regulator
LNDSGIPPMDTYGVLNLRCYTEPAQRKTDKNSGGRRGEPANELDPIERMIKEIGHPWDGHVFAFDTETTTDMDQTLRFGIWHVYGIDPSERVRLALEGKLTGKALDRSNVPFAYLGVMTINHRDLPPPYEKGVVYNPDALAPEEIETLKLFARACGYFAHNVKEFVKEVFYRWVYYNRALCVGHNLPFDLSRLATEWKPSRGSFRRGFNLKLCGCPYEQCYNHPAVRIKHIGRLKSFLDFQSATIPGSAARNYKGAFLDTASFGNALLGGGDATLGKMGERFNAGVRKTEPPGHGEKLTFEYLKYAVRDVEATYSLYQAERDLYRKHGLSREITEIYSEASLGKAYLEELRIIPFMRKNPNFPRDILGYGMAAYYGGRTEVRERLKPIEVIYCDFKSQYPTVNALMGLQDLLLAKEVNTRECTREAQELLERVTPDDLLRPETWKNLRILVKVLPRGDLLPVRTDYGTGKQTGDNPLNAEPTWYTLPDVAASKIRIGKVPEILEALELVPEGRQEGLRQIKLFGDDRYTVDLDRDDFFTRVIDLRSEIKAEARRAESAAEREHLDGLEQALKLIANATSYGTLLEIKQSEPTVKGEKVTVWDNNGSVTARAPVLEEPGTYFFGPAGALIPAGGRLLLAMAEALAEREGIGYAFCDTDSMAFARPEGMSRKEFQDKVKRIATSFDALSPYEGDAPLLELEDINFDQERNLKPLYFIGVSAKRYVLYNREEDGNYTIRKFSSHGLGVWGDLEKKGYRSPEWIPEPQIKVEKMGGYRWVYDIWYQTIKAVEKGDTSPDISRYDFPDDIMASFQVTYSTPYLMDIYPVKGTRPFSFFEVYPALTEEDVLLRTRGDTTDPLNDLVGVVCYSDYGDRENIRRKDTGEKVDPKHIKTMKEALRGFFTHPESKSGDPTGIGLLPRRYVKAIGTVSVGKVINRITEHTSDIEDIPGLAEGEQKYAERFSLREILKSVPTGELAKVSEVSPTTLKEIKREEVNPSMATVRKILKGIEKIKTLRAHNIDPNEVVVNLNAGDADMPEAHHLLLAAKEELTWGELEEVTGIPASTLRQFARAGRISKKNAQRIKEKLPVFGMGVSEFEPMREKLIRSGLPIMVLRDLLGVEPRILKEILECAHSPRPLTANRIKERLPAIDAYLDDLESAKDMSNKLLSKYSQRELSRITGTPCP